MRGNITIALFIIGWPARPGERSGRDCLQPGSPHRMLSGTAERVYITEKYSGQRHYAALSSTVEYDENVISHRHLFFRRVEL